MAILTEHRQTKQSELLFKNAQTLIPGGVNSPVRAFGAVGGTPPFIQSAHGAYITDVDGNSYIDYVGSWGPAILGHAHPAVVAAVKEAAEQGLSFGAPSPREIQLAKIICDLMPSIEKIRLVNSGTEATMTAIRLARGVTKKSKIIKFEGCYHGHADSLLVKAGSGALTFGQPTSAGISDATVADTLVAQYNDSDAVVSLFESNPNAIAAIIVEPIAANMNLVYPSPTFLTTLRELCDHYQALLIFDEVITGFRVGLNGAQSLFNITPDLTTLGKIIGGGMPIGALGGKASLMEYLAPLGPVYQAGTLSGNPVAMAAGVATLLEIQKPHFYEKLEQITGQLIEGILSLAQDLKLPLHAQHVGSLFGLYLTHSNPTLFKLFFHGMLEQGIYLAPSSYEAGFVSAAHTQKDIFKTLKAIETTCVRLLS